MTLEYKLFYQRHLPHYQPPGAKLFVTFRLADSLPAVVLQQLLEEKDRLDAKHITLEKEQKKSEEDRAWRYLFGKLDEALAKQNMGTTWLKDKQIASLVVESLHYGDNRQYELDAYCIMPNHVHLVCTPLSQENKEYVAIAKIMQSIKGYTARKANQILNRQGAFWVHENYDRVIRDDDEWHRITGYIQMNPVKAGLVDSWEKWDWTYVRL
jgi:putative transposase